MQRAIRLAIFDIMPDVFDFTRLGVSASCASQAFVSLVLPSLNISIFALICPSVYAAAASSPRKGSRRSEILTSGRF
jgi:hypothetical protein